MSRPLKNLLSQGDILDRFGRTQLPTETGHSSFATSPEGAASQPVGLSGVKSDSINVPDGVGSAKAGYKTV